MAFELHRLIREGNEVELLRLLERSAGKDAINEIDRRGKTPLMLAVQSDRAGADMVRLLIQNGANVKQTLFSPDGARSVISLAVSGGNADKVQALLQHGADIHYLRSGQYDALLDAVYGRVILRDAGLLDLLRLLISLGVHLNTVTSYKEAALRVLSKVGRFDAVRLLLDAGADESLLQWTPLHRAVALGTVSDVEQEINRDSIEMRDWWDRTPWLLSILTGDLAKARLLKKRGADEDARGRSGKTPLQFAIEGHQTAMLEWLLETWVPVEEVDDFETSPLMTAADHGNEEAVELLLKAEANIDACRYGGQTALSMASNSAVASLLLNAGADPAKLSFETRRALIGFASECDESELIATHDEFREGRKRKFGKANPDEMDEPFWQCMIRSGVPAFEARSHYLAEEKEEDETADWCAHRFGQTLTFLPNGDSVQVGGEHEDYYDRDFCIYNDVFLHGKDGNIRIFGYPPSVFPPTDFHTATLIGEYIYLIGSLGYSGHRSYGNTPVYRLHLGSFQIEPVESNGTAPGWIYEHKAVRLNSDEIEISGGMLVTVNEGLEEHSANSQKYIFDTSLTYWRRA